MNSKTAIKNKLDEVLKTASITTSAYVPEKLILNQNDHLLRFSELIQRPGITVVDQIQQQLKEYIKLSYPSKRLSDDEIQHLLVQHIGSTPLWEYGCWFFYPWANRLVHLLDEQEFIAVRTSRNQYKITPEERDLLATKKIGIVGLSVGQSVSVTLAMERICGELRLADFDLLELTNLNRIRTGTQNLGILKAHSVAREIAELDPYLKVLCFTDGLTEENMDAFFTGGGKLDLLVEESDGFDIKVLSRYKARELQVPVIMEASDRCMVDVERFDLEPNRPILHGILDHLDVATLKSLTTNEEKIPYMFNVLGLKSTSAKLKASMLEMQQTITTWPQLASAVTMGGGITADVSRRLLLNDFKSSGRYYVDIDELIGDKPEPFYVPQKNETPVNLNSPQTLNAVYLTSEISEQQINAILDAMRFAPTFGNQQSWSYNIKNGSIIIFYPSKNPLPNTDCDNTQLNISIGTVIECAVQKAAELGYITHKFVTETAEYNAPIVNLSFEKSTNEIQNLGALLSKRKTNRSFGSAANIDTQLILKLKEISLGSGLKLHIVNERKKIDALASVMATAERINLLQAARHYDFYNNIYKDETSNDDVGISVSNMALPNAMKIAYSVLESSQVAASLAKWQKGTAFENYHKALISSSDALLFISADTDSFTKCIEVGEALTKLWCTAINNSLAFHPICVSLTLLKQINLNSMLSSSLSVAMQNELRHIENEFKETLSVSTSSNVLFAARIFSSNTDLPDSKRKSIDEFLFKSQSVAV